MEETL
jgi:hypothetical protein